ncbi:hypothetical protein MSAN_00946500 [Mycena sanguinolenta]|uniref:Uncharacterized protein n=1 Tax=Mycena sanguinolenta TaxID=230812 RepID=A0A8H6YV07_9AGAR|nr:hypothetical protein MSAN_00946500 [Mycena sanguinolenta]
MLRSQATSAEPHTMVLRATKNASQNANPKRKRESGDESVARGKIRQWDIPAVIEEIPASQAGMAQVLGDVSELFAQLAEKAAASASASKEHISEAIIKSLHEVGELRKKNAKLIAELDERADLLEALKQAHDHAMETNTELAREFATQTLSVAALTNENDRLSTLLAETKDNFAVKENEAAAAQESLKVEISQLNLKLEQTDVTVELLRSEVQEVTATAETFKDKFSELRKQTKDYFSTMQIQVAEFLAKVPNDVDEH